jgi:DNA polymerase-3 subunit gamma/tau
VTVLSRCLQFNLKRMPVGQIAEHMKALLEKEGVPFEPSGLRLVAQAADGSMRDGLSLLDQLIAFGGGKAGEEEARAMLGTISRDHVERLAELLASMNVQELMKCARSLEEFAPDYAQVLDELAGLLVRIAMKQAVSEFEGDDLYPPELLERLAKALSPEDIQLYYQTAIIGRRDLALAPDPRTGFEMTLLRMMAFRPENDATMAQVAGPASSSVAASRGSAAAAQAAVQAGLSGQGGNGVGGIAGGGGTGGGGGAAAARAAAQAGASGAAAARAAALGGPPRRSGAGGSAGSSASGGAASGGGPGSGASGAAASGGGSGSGATGAAASSGGSGASGVAASNGRSDTGTATLGSDASPGSAGAQGNAWGGSASDSRTSRGSAGNGSQQGGTAGDSERASGAAQGAPTNGSDSPDPTWPATLNQLDLQGSAKELARHCVLLGRQGGLVRLALDPRVKFVRTPAQEEKLTQALSRCYGEPVRIEITMASGDVETPFQAEQRASQQELEGARQSFESHPDVQGFRERFGATVLPNSVRQDK